MSLVIKFYLTSMLNMFRILIYPSSGAHDCSVELPHSTEQSRAPDGGYINIQNMLSIEEVK